MTSLPPQSPVRRTVALRPRNDRAWLPTFREPMPRREFVQPIEAYDPSNEPRPFAWSELLDPQVWFGGGLLFAILVLVLIVVLSSGPTPA